MKKLEKILESEFKLILLNNKVNIINYKEIKELKEDSIIIVSNQIVEIKGKNLILNKMMHNELLITGKIKRINII